MLSKSHNQVFEKFPSLQEVAERMSVYLPRFIRHMYPYMFKPINVPPSQMFVLMILEEEKMCTLSVLSKKLNVSPPTISGLINRLVKRGYVKRCQDKQDGRVVNVSLTKSGNILIKYFRKNILEKWKLILRNFSPRERMGPLLFVEKVLEDIKKK